MILRKYSTLFFATLLIAFFLYALAGGYVTVLGLTGFKLSSLAGFIVFFLGTFLLTRKLSMRHSLKVLLFVFLGTFILDFPARLFEFEASFISLLRSLIWLGGMLTGFLTAKCKPVFLKSFSSVIFILAGLWLSTHGYDRWMNKLNFGTYLGIVNEPLPDEVIFYDNVSGELINICDLPGEYILLDFWSKGCSYCFEKFPDIQRLYDGLKNTEQAQIYSVYCTKNDEYLSGQEILKKYGHTVPLLSTNDRQYTKLGVKLFPTVLIFDRDRNIIFRGDTNLAIRYMLKLTYSLI